MTVGRPGQGKEAGVAWLLIFASPIRRNTRSTAIAPYGLAHHGPFILVFYQKKTKHKLIHYHLNETL